MVAADSRENFIPSTKKTPRHIFQVLNVDKDRHDTVRPYVFNSFLIQWSTNSMDVTKITTLVRTFLYTALHRR